MELFYDGLREDVKDEIAKEDRPDTFDEFVSKVIKIDNRLYARRLDAAEKTRAFVDLLEDGPSRKPANAEIFLCYLILHVFSESLVEEFHLTVVLPGEGSPSGDR
ncbi:hypothetical protein E4U09_003620 [Claviceps aff. purpurea]|uniref:Uncharacterized protein n=1 Tax=Claviceps aff. purpurea TaxID=1967640 RepID=A0A9P7QE63_9HYPO|nr:hypothetical protein E4U09_003620 [Claviceps aff. purpurea]